MKLLSRQSSCWRGRARHLLQEELFQTGYGLSYSALVSSAGVVLKLFKLETFIFLALNSQNVSWFPYLVHVQSLSPPGFGSL